MMKIIDTFVQKFSWSAVVISVKLQLSKCNVHMVSILLL